MCGIVIARTLKEIDSQLQLQHNRWLHSIGIMCLWTWEILRQIQPTSDKSITTFNAKYWYYSTEPQINYKQIHDVYIKKINQWNIENKTTGPYLMHHRKASMWIISIDNAHPYYYKDAGLLFLQNWTNDEFKDYQKIISITNPEFSDKTDSRMIWDIIAKHPDKEQEYMDLAVGVKIIVDMNKSQIRIYWDWLRDFFADPEQKFFASYDTMWEEYKWTWELHLDFDLNVIRKNYKQIDSYPLATNKPLLYQSNFKLPPVNKPSWKDTDHFAYWTLTEDEHDIFDMLITEWCPLLEAEAFIKDLRRHNGNIPFNSTDYPPLTEEDFAIKITKYIKKQTKLNMFILRRAFEFYILYYQEIQSIIWDSAADNNQIIDLYSNYLLDGWE